MAERRKRNDPVRRSGPSSHRALARLLRLVGPEGIATSNGPDGTVLLAGRGASDPATLRLALSSGLISEKGGLLVWTAETRAFLRRQALEPVDRFAGQHRDIAMVHLEGRQDERRDETRVSVNRLASVTAGLARLRDKDGVPWFPADAIEAGERLARDFQHGGLSPSVTMRWAPRLSDRVQGSEPGRAELSDSAMAARQRVNRAARALGPDLSGVVLDACCFEKGLELIERERLWPARSAKLLLRVGLMALHRHYHPVVPDPKPRDHVWHDRQKTG